MLITMSLHEETTTNIDPRVPVFDPKLWWNDPIGLMVLGSEKSVLHGNRSGPCLVSPVQFKDLETNENAE